MTEIERSLGEIDIRLSTIEVNRRGDDTFYAVMFDDDGNVIQVLDSEEVGDGECYKITFDPPVDFSLRHKY